jgi:inosine/xanthosine triphosphatase
MDVAVGSQNPVKKAATERAFDGLRTVTVETVAVDSGVSEQPWGRDETITGAENRARRALDATDASLGIGIEGGVTELDARPGLFLIMWAAVTDGERVTRGGGPAMRLPEHIAGRLEDGAELGPVLDDLLHTSGVAKDRGAAGVLTGGSIDREAALAHAVAGALGPFVTDHYE